LTLLGGHTVEKIWRGRPCRVCSHFFEPKKSAKLELSGADLGGANLSQAKLESANLSGANLVGGMKKGHHSY